MSGNGTLDWWRNATPEEKAERRAQMATEREAAEAKRAAEREEYVQRVYSTEALEADVAKGGYGVSTHPRQARQLLRLDTIERRRRAKFEAMTRQNLMGGILSDNLFYAVSDLLAMIAAGREAEEMYGERTAREYRERENEAKAAHLAAVAHALHNR